MMNFRKTYIVCIFLSIFVLISCKQKPVIIKKDYVINPNWNKTDNAFHIIKMKLKSEKDSLNINQVTVSQLVEILEEDTSYSFVTNITYDGTKYSKRKIYFNKYNGFMWRKPPYLDKNRDRTFKTIGKLQQNTWYLLAGLSQNRTLFYIYIDSLDNVYRFKKQPLNW